MMQMNRAFSPTQLFGIQQLFKTWPFFDINSDIIHMCINLVEELNNMLIPFEYMNL